MCGIFGMVGRRWQDNVAEALATLDARGPDDRDAWIKDEICLGHTRLAVIDIAGGHQPMHHGDGRYSIVFNGEIYNFQSLRQELESAGNSFSTASDTEVLLQGYRAWGEALIPKLDGMFALAIWDEVEKSLFLARDRIGIKPLFYALLDGEFVFASTLAPFLALPGFPRQLDPEALRDYLAFQTVPAPRSILSDVRQLPPACQMRFSMAGGLSDPGQYWDIPPGEADSLSFEERVEQIDSALRESLRRQRVADVPVGAFLSGGIDSSLMVHYLADMDTRPLRTFSMRFEQKSFDESASALAVAEKYDTEHHIIDAPDIDGDRFRDIVRHLDQPLADAAYITTTELSRLTREHVTVAISGDGGDELFAGYPRFQETPADYPDSALRGLIRGGVRSGLLPGALLRRGLAGKEHLFYRRVELGPFDPSRKGMGAYLQSDIREAARLDDTLRGWRDRVEGFDSNYGTGAQMRADLWNYLSENCLMKTDRASMAHSLEVRVPMLGNPVLDTVLPWQADVHYDADGGKAILRELAKRYLPETVWNRPKHGFSVPIKDYFNGAWADVCDDVVDRCESIAPMLQADNVRTLWQQAKAGKASRRLAYTFVVLLLWLDRNRLEM